MSPNQSKKIQILGTRGIPANHGGFETFAEHFSTYLINKGWQVTVFCQEDGKGVVWEDTWNGVRLIHIPVDIPGAKGTIVFDWISTRMAAKAGEPVLTLGYNTAVFCALYRIKGIKNVINMDGIEWQRAKWTFGQRTWLYINEKAGGWLGNHLVADHPEIKNHLSKFIPAKKITVIPYSAAFLSGADPAPIKEFGLEENGFTLLIARPEPENSILEVIQAYCAQKRDIPLVVLGNYDPDAVEYQKKVLDAANEDVRFVGAIYDAGIVQSLRYFARFYIHGHTVGGTNPSLVEALGAGSPVLAHNNRFNRWVAGSGQAYFSSQEDCKDKIDTLLEDDSRIAAMKKASVHQYQEKFTADAIHGAYETLLEKIQ